MSKRRRERNIRGSNQAQNKWIAYILLILLALVLERCVFNRLPLQSAVPQLLPLLTAAIGFFEGAAPGAWLGLGAGFLSSLLTGETALLWFCPLLSIYCGSTRNKALGRTFFGYLLCAVGGMLLLEAGEILWRYLFLDWELASLLSVALAEGGYSLLFVPVWYLLCWQINDRMPGELRV